MNKEKTAMQQLIDFIGTDDNYNFTTAKQAIREIRACATELLEVEKKQLCNFWLEGNRQGWAQTTDHPEDAETYYTTKFNQPQ